MCQKPEHFHFLSLVWEGVYSCDCLTGVCINEVWNEIECRIVKCCDRNTSSISTLGWLSRSSTKKTYQDTTTSPGLITGLYSTNESKEIVIIIDLLQFSVTQSEVLKSRVWEVICFSCEFFPADKYLA